MAEEAPRRVILPPLRVPKSAQQIAACEMSAESRYANGRSSRSCCNSPNLSPRSNLASKPILKPPVSKPSASKRSVEVVDLTGDDSDAVPNDARPAKRVRTTIDNDGLRAELAVNSNDRARQPRPQSTTAPIASRPAPLSQGYDTIPRYSFVQQPAPKKRAKSHYAQQREIFLAMLAQELERRPPDDPAHNSPLADLVRRPQEVLQHPRRPIQHPRIQPHRRAEPTPDPALVARAKAARRTWRQQLDDEKRAAARKEAMCDQDGYMAADRLRRRDPAAAKALEEQLDWAREQRFVSAAEEYEAAETDEELVAARAEIRADAELRTVEKLILLLVSQIPVGQWTTYEAIFTHIKKVDLRMRRAEIERGLRMNRWAAVPTHRVLEKGSIGPGEPEWGYHLDISREVRHGWLVAEGVRFGAAGQPLGGSFRDFVGRLPV